MLTTAEAAVLLGVSLQHVRYLIRRGTLSARRVGRDWLLTRAAVEKARVRPGPGRPTAS